MEKYGKHIKEWNKNKRKKPKGMILHHINGDYNLNDIKNLILVTPGEHIKIHNAWRKKFGKIKKGFVINHIDKNPKNINPENIEMIPYYEYFEKNYPHCKTLIKRSKNAFFYRR